MVMGMLFYLSVVTSGEHGVLSICALGVISMPSYHRIHGGHAWCGSAVGNSTTIPLLLFSIIIIVIVKHVYSSIKNSKHSDLRGIAVV